MAVAFTKTPKLFQWIFPKRVWAFSRNIPEVYLTFDDGPIPDITPWVLKQLSNYNAKATFFCIGDNVRKHPTIFQQIKEAGHSIGNHTFHHLNGWKTATEDYINNTELCDSEFRIQNPDFVNLFRPPYGKMNASQSKKLQKKGYTIIMWDVLTRDYDATISEEKCLKQTLNSIQQGSIVVFHDSIKAERNLKFVLPKVLEYCATKKWKLKAI